MQWLCSSPFMATEYGTAGVCWFPEIVRHQDSRVWHKDRKISCISDLEIQIARYADIIQRKVRQLFESKTIWVDSKQTVTKCQTNLFVFQYILLKKVKGRLLTTNVNFIFDLILNPGLKGVMILVSINRCNIILFSANYSVCQSRFSVWMFHPLGYDV